MGRLLKHKLDVAPLVGLVGVLVALVLLQLGVEGGYISKWLFSTPVEITAAIAALADAGVLGQAFIDTMSAVAICFLLVAVFGLALGYILYRAAAFGRAYENLLGSLFSVPTVLLFPIFLVVFGRSYQAIIALSFLHCVIPVIIYTREGLIGVPDVMVRVGRSFRVSERQMFWKIMMPQAAPTIFVGLRLALIYVLLYTVGVEFLITFGGLGRLVAESYMRFEIPTTFAVISFVIFLSTVLYFVLKGIERWLRRVR